MVSIKGVDLAIFIKSEKINSENIFYFTKVETDHGVLVLAKRKKPVLFISSLEKKSKNKDIIVEHINKNNIFEHIKEHKPKSIGFVYSEISKSTFDFFKKKLPKVKFKNISDELAKLKRKKTSSEILKHKKAIAITEQILSKLYKNISSMTFEYEAFDFLRMEVLKHGLVESFKPIIASGKNSKNPHYYPSKTSKLQTGFCIIDFGIKFEGYCSDISRTIFLGTPTTQDKKYYESVRKEQERIETSTHAGTSKIKTSFKMIHALGHGLGLEVHEPPFVGVERLNKNDVIALEPARYDGLYGVRIEDDYLVTEKKLVRLSSSSRNLKRISFILKA